MSDSLVSWFCFLALCFMGNALADISAILHQIHKHQKGQQDDE